MALQKELAIELCRETLSWTELTFQYLLSHSANLTIFSALVCTHEHGVLLTTNIDITEQEDKLRSLAIKLESPVFILDGTKGPVPSLDNFVYVTTGNDGIVESRQFHRMNGKIVHKDSRWILKSYLPEVGQCSVHGTLSAPCWGKVTVYRSRKVCAGHRFSEYRMTSLEADRNSETEPLLGLFNY